MTSLNTQTSTREEFPAASHFCTRPLHLLLPGKAVLGLYAQIVQALSPLRSTHRAPRLHCHQNNLQISAVVSKAADSSAATNGFAKVSSQPRVLPTSAKMMIPAPTAARLLLVTGKAQSHAYCSSYLRGKLGTGNNGKLASRQTVSNSQP